MLLLAAAVCAAGCAGQQRPAAHPGTPPIPLQTASKQQLVASFNQQANAIESLNLGVTMKLTAGTAYSGVIKQYHEVSGFILAQKPDRIRVIGQAPIVGTTIFDMASNGERFQIYIPSKDQFIEGPANLARPSERQLENLKPQHLVEALFWNEIPPDAPVLFEAGDEATARYYTLTVVEGSEEWRVRRKIWFDRTDLTITRLQIYDTEGNVTEDVAYRNWNGFATARFASEIDLTRPIEDYGLTIGITKLTVNQPVTADKFELSQPPGTKLIHVGETPEQKP
jgi:outer membrane lipoprotein-sorting protein